MKLAIAGCFDRIPALRFALPGLLSLASVLIATRPALAQVPAECPDSLERTEYYVAPGPRFLRATNAGGMESVILTGLAQWLEERARAEFRLWVVDDTLGRICGKPDGEAGGNDDKPSPLRPYFPSTCDLHRRLSTADPLQLGVSYDVLVTAAREDLEYVPACAVYRLEDRGLPIGYLLQSVYEQLSQEVALDRLLHGLANHEKLNLAHDGTKLCRREDGVFTSYCGVFIPLLAYAAARESSHEAKTFVTLMQAKFMTHGLGDLDWDEQELTLLQAALQRLVNDAKRINDLLKELEELDDAPREEAVPRLLLLGDLVAGLLDIGFQGLQIENPELERNTRILSELIKSYAAVRAREYVTALTRIAVIGSGGEPIYRCDPGDAQQACTDSSREALRTIATGVTLIASLAEAKSGDQFAARLDQIASPVGAYRLKRVNPLWTLNGFPGLSYGEQELTLPDSTVVTSDTAAVFAPLGFARSWPSPGNKWSLGFFFPVIDVGNLVEDSQGDIRIEGATITSDVEASFSNVFAPGLYLTASHRALGPMTFGVGMSQGTAGHKIVKLDAGGEVEAEREWGLRLFFAMDVVVLPFRR